MTSNFIESDIGYYKKTNTSLVFFGKKQGSLSAIKEQFPNLNFKNINQVHGDHCLEASDRLTEADAHWTNKKNTALIIKTADCIPLFLITNDTAIAIHAGWRGVANQITKKAISLTNLNNYQAYIGPHILKESFQVKEDCYQIFKSLDSHRPEYISKNNDHFYIDLQAYIKEQVSNSAKVISLNVNTNTHAELHSYRRDKAQAGRNISFCALL